MKKLPRSGRSSEFNRSIRTDGYSASVAIIKSFHRGGSGGGLQELVSIDKPEDDGDIDRLLDAEEADLGGNNHTNTTYERMKAQFQSIPDRSDRKVSGVDPGRTCIWTATDYLQAKGLTPTSSVHYDTRHYTNANYQHDRWSSEHKKIIERWMKEVNIKDIVDNSPSSKVSDMSTYIRYIFRHFEPVLDFYLRPEVRHLSFYSYQRRIRALDRMCKDLTQGDPTRIIAFGNAKFNSTSKGHFPTPNRAFRRRLKLHCTCAEVDEYRTSQVCSRCAWSSTELKESKEEKYDDDTKVNPFAFDLISTQHRIRTVYDRGKSKKTITSVPMKENTQGTTKEEKNVEEHVMEPFSVRICPKCHTQWNRDTNASRNILFIFLAISNDLPLPPAFDRVAVKHARDHSEASQVTEH